MYKICVCCLASDRKLHPINTLWDTFHTITQNHHTLPQNMITICWECKAFLKRIASFKKKALHSLSLLQQYSDLSKIKQHHKFKSTLATSPVEVIDNLNPVQAQIQIEELSDDIKTEYPEIPIDPQMELIIPDINETTYSPQISSAVLTNQISNIGVNSPQVSNIGVNPPQISNIGMNTPQISNIGLNQISGVRLNTPQLSNIGMKPSKISGVRLNTPQMSKIGLNTSQISTIGFNTPPMNSIRLNAPQMSGIRLNPPPLSSIGLNNTQISGVQLNASQLNNIGLNSLQINSIGSNTLEINGLALNTSRINGQPLNTTQNNGFNYSSQIVNTGTNYVGVPVVIMPMNYQMNQNVQVAQSSEIRTEESDCVIDCIIENPESLTENDDGATCSTQDLEDPLLIPEGNIQNFSFEVPVTPEAEKTDRTKRAEQTGQTKQAEVPTEKANTGDLWSWTLVSKAKMLEWRKKDAKKPLYVGREYKCPTCIVAYDHAEHLRRHNATNHYNSLGPCVCEICQRRFSHLVMLKVHREEHRRLYECKVCHMTTRHRSVMVIHCKMEHGKSSKKCEKCDAHLVKNSPLSKCHRCGMKDSNVEVITYSKKAKPSKNYCSLCQIQYGDDDAYQNHLTKSLKHRLLQGNK